MHALTLPLPPSQPDRLSLVCAAADTLRAEGWAEVRAQHCRGYRAPQPVVVPDLNLPLQPELSASHPARRAPLLACVGATEDLGDADAIRRWRALAAWAAHQGASFVLFVERRDVAHTRALAGRWGVPPDCIRGVTPPRPGRASAQPERHHQAQVV